MFRGVRNLVFRSEAPPVFAATSITMFAASLVVFGLRGSFASRLPLSPCKPTETLFHFRSYNLCATAPQAAHWARLVFLWKTLFAGSFVVHFAGIGYRRLVARRSSTEPS